jgi:predicted dehydrogenase
MATIRGTQTYRVGIIGCGRRPSVDPATGRRSGYGIAESHANGYAAFGRTKLAAAADVDPENLADFIARRALPAAGGYTDYREMLAREALDIVSVCTWPALHPQMVVDAAAAGLQAILCEKPMALTLPECDRMLAACAQHGVKLVVNHQRRFGAPFQFAKRLVQEGAIGDVQRVEGWIPRGTLLDWGTHWFDMFLFYLDQEPVTWMLGQADRREPRVLFGVPSETQTVTVWEHRNGVRGFMETGVASPGQPANRIIGTQGVIEVGPQPPTAVQSQGQQAPAVREYPGPGPAADARRPPNAGLPASPAPVVRAQLRGDTSWHVPSIDEGIHGSQNFQRSVAELVAAIEQDREPLHNGRNARQALELILAGYESAYRRRRVDLPLTIEDLPLARLVQAWEQP